MIKKESRGFTLIELLVVIAIIGILATVVLTSLSGARVRANSSAFKSEIAAMQPTLVSDCDTVDALSGSAALAGTTKHDACTTVDAANSCGSNGNGTFTVTCAAVNGVQGECASAEITETGITFTSIAGGSC